MGKKIDEHFFLRCAELTAESSKDESTKLGAVIVDPNGQIISVGRNTLPHNVKNTPTRQSRPEKYYWFVHAERQSIYTAARNGQSTYGATMYCSCGMSCADCAIAIIESGIEEVWFRSYDTTQHPERWLESAKRSKIMFDEAGVRVKYYVE